MGAIKGLNGPQCGLCLAMFAIFAHNTARAADPPAKKPESRVSAKAYLSFDKLPPGKTCDIVVFVKIAEGWHMNTNVPKLDWQVPTKLTIQSKHGVTLGKLSYEKGILSKIAGADQPVPVYENETVIRGVLTVPAEAAGQADELLIQVDYQLCNLRTCLEPSKVKLVGKVEIAENAADAKPVNPNLFPKTP